MTARTLDRDAKLKLWRELDGNGLVCDLLDRLETGPAASAPYTFHASVCLEAFVRIVGCTAEHNPDDRAIIVDAAVRVLQRLAARLPEIITAVIDDDRRLH